MAILACIFNAALASPANADEMTLMDSGGLMVVPQADADKTVFCITADEHHRIAAQFGIEIDVPPPEAASWNETFPKMVAESDYYFKLPLIITLNNKSGVSGRHVSFDLGMCSDDWICQRRDFTITIPEGKTAAKEFDRCRAAKRPS